MKNTLIAVDKTGSYRVYLTVTTDMVREAARIHNTTNLASAALGRTLTAAGIMGLMMKADQDRFMLQIKGDGPAGEILARSNGRGEVKGYISNPAVELPPKYEGKLNVGAAVGNGSLTVIRDLGLKEPYVGRIDLVSGEIAEDLTKYFAVSEQQPSSVALGVRFADGTEITQAGGMVVQVLPGVSEECLNALEDALFYMDNLSLLIEDSQKATVGSPDETAILKDLLTRIFGSLPEEYQPEILEYREIKWYCDCSKERMAEALVTIGKKDLAALIEEDGKAQLNCQFCRTSYDFTRDELLEILKYAIEK